MSKVNIDDLTVIYTAEDLETYRALENNKIEGLPCYDNFLQKIKRGFYQDYYTNEGIDDRPYQLEYAAVMCCRRYNTMGWSMSVGKTLSSLLTLYGLYEESLHSMRRCAVHIVVFNLLSTMRWIEELDKFSFFRGMYTVITKESDLKSCQTPIIIYSQDFPKCRSKSRKTTSRPYMSRVLGRFRPNMLLVDEVHGLKNNSTRAKHLTYIRNRSRRVLALTGTPSDGNLKELHNVLEFVYKKEWPYTNSNAFSKHFGTKEKFSANYIYGSVTNPDSPDKYLQKLDSKKMSQYYKLMRRFIHRVKLDEPQVISCMKLPEAEVVLHEIQPSKTQQKEYNQYVSEHKESLSRAALVTGGKQLAEALRLIHPLIYVTNHPLEIAETEPLPKLEKLVDITKEAKGKVVVFCERVNSAWLCAQRLRNEYPDRVVRLYSQDEREDPVSLDTENRIEIVTRFQYEDSVKAGVFSMTLAGQAIDLTNATDVVYYCLPWSSIKLQQSINRVVRSGNKNDKVYLHYLYQKGMIDEYQVNLSLEKIKGSRLMLDYEVDEFDEEDLSDFSPIEVIKRLLGG